jgi:EF-hand domain pair
MSPPHMIESDSAPTLPYRIGSPHKAVGTTSDDRFLADSSGHSSSGHGGGRRNAHGSPTKPSRTTSARGGGRRETTTTTTTTAAGSGKPSTLFARQTRHVLHQQILLAQEKLNLVEDLDRMTTNKKLNCLFQLVDGDGSGMVDAQELAAILRLRNANLTERESLDRAANMVSAFDADGNAELDQEEFRTFIATMLDQLQLDSDEFVEFLIFHIAYPDATPKKDVAATSTSQSQRQQPPQPSTAGSPRRSTAAATTKTVPTRPRPSPRPSVSSSCSGSTITTANETILTASSLSTSASASTPVAVGDASPSNQHPPTTRSGHHTQQQRTVVSIPKRVRNVGSTGGAGGDIMRRRASTNMHRAVVPGHSSP